MHNTGSDDDRGAGISRGEALTGLSLVGGLALLLVGSIVYRANSGAQQPTTPATPGNLATSAPPASVDSATVAAPPASDTLASDQRVEREAAEPLVDSKVAPAIYTSPAGDAQ